MPISAASFGCFRYDNLASAVRKIPRGYRREETVRFLAFRSHWWFAAEFCTPGEGHEKGGIEGEGGYFRRNHLVPVPRVADLDALNTMLVTACRGDDARILDGRTDTVGAAMAIERGGGRLYRVAWRLRRSGGAISADRSILAQAAARSDRCRRISQLRPAAA